VPSTPENDITPLRKPSEKNLFHSSDTLMKETIENQNPIYSSLYPVYPEDYTNLSRISVESVKGSEIAPMYFPTDINDKKSLASSYSKKKDSKIYRCREKNFYRK